MAAPEPKNRNILLAVGAIVVVFLIWGAWTWGNWGDAGDGVDDSPAAPVQPATLPSGEAEAVAAAPANNAPADASGDAAEGDRTVTREPARP